MSCPWHTLLREYNFPAFICISDGNGVYTRRPDVMQAENGADEAKNCFAAFAQVGMDLRERIPEKLANNIPVMNEQRLTIAEMHQWLKSRLDCGNQLIFDHRSQLFTTTDANGIFELALPLICPPLNGERASDAVMQFQAHPLTAIILLIQAGYAALGYCEGDTLVHHKMVKKYMVRQSQGKSQLTYKKSKGKSRLGSRIRLHNSVIFFEEINQTLHNWNVLPRCNRILMSLPVNLTNLLYSANVPPPFKKKDPRIRRIPLDVKTPSYKELCHIHWEMTHGRLMQKSSANSTL